LAANACLLSPGAAALAVRDALYERDGASLSALVHGGMGVRVSPAAFVDPEADRVLDREAVRALWSDTEAHDWGYAEGSGELIRMTGADFVAAYVTDLPFEAAEVNLHDPEAAPASTVDNAAVVYPEATIVEFTTGQAAEDWAALRMAFVPENGCQRLVGLIRARWSP
jgi:hypothetical protein